MTAMPATHPARAAHRWMRRGMMPSRNSPSMPPEKMDDSFHQASMILSTLSMAMATKMPMMPTSTLDRRKT